jgi:hypothetical protein
LSRGSATYSRLALRSSTQLCSNFPLTLRNELSQPGILSNATAL